MSTKLRLIYQSFGLNKMTIYDSFPAIVGFNDNGAIVHYRPRKNEDKKIEQDGVLIIDQALIIKEVQPT